MKRNLKQTINTLYHYVDGKKQNGPSAYLWGNCSRLSGDCSGLRGNCSGLRGNCSGLSGDCSGLRGNCSGLSGDCSDLSGNLDDCEITPQEREKGINIADLAKQD